MKPYLDFIKDKVITTVDEGYQVDPEEINPLMKPHARDIAVWMIRGGRRACFASFGLHKTTIQHEVVRLVRERSGGMGLIVTPLGVRQEFMRDAQMLATGEHPNITDDQRQDLKAWQANRPGSIVFPKFIRRIEEAEDPNGVYLTNYETIRDGKLDPRLFTVASLDEAAVLRGFGGTKTFREFMRLFTTDAGPLGNRRQGVEVKHRFVATATPSPNDYIELLAYAAYLGILDVSQAKTRFFKRDSTNADNLTLLPHKEQEFWLWVASWAVFIQRPSDLGYSDEGYELPALDIRWHEIQVNSDDTGFERDGQKRLLRNASLGVTGASREKRISLKARVAKMMDIRAEDPAAHRVIWHDLEAERKAIENAVPGVVTVYGSQSDEDKEHAIIGFSDGKIQEIAGKPVMLGAGVNWQRFCAWAIYLGIGFKFNDFIQSIHRLQRFLQLRRVRIDLIYTDAEIGIRRTLERKWAQHNEMVKKMTDLIKEYGLSHAAMMSRLNRALGVERVEVSGKHHKLVLNDSVIETGNMEENSVGLILTSIPFSTQYEYSPNYCDFGHTDNNDHFFEQMDYLTPNLLHALQPGRIMAIHVKDRIVPGGMTGLGFQTVYPFHARCIEHYTTCPECREKKAKDRKHVCTHRFGYMGMKTIVTDVVRENNQTYRLGWTEQCKDGSKMGVGMPEYLLIFRKPPTDTANSYADNPVVKSKKKYSLARWQVDAHGFSRSSGNRLLDPDEVRSLSHGQIFKLFRDYSLETVYDFEHHVKIGEQLARMKRLPVTFMLLQPQSWSPEVWTDITRMLTLNGAQSAKGKTMHLCPMQFDLADRAIEQWSMPGEVVLDPFAGLGTVPYRAVLLGRHGMGIELSSPYFLDSVSYCEAAEEKIAMPDLFSTMETQAVPEEVSA